MNRQIEIYGYKNPLDKGKLVKRVKTNMTLHRLDEYCKEKYPEFISFSFSYLGILKRYSHRRIQGTF